MLEQEEGQGDEQDVNDGKEAREAVLVDRHRRTDDTVVGAVATCMRNQVCNRKQGAVEGEPKGVEQVVNFCSKRGHPGKEEESIGGEILRM